MIGNLVHYNCAGSTSIGIITDMFRYEAAVPRPGLGPYKNTLVVAVSWVKQEGPVPQPLQPRIPGDFFTGGDEEYWPIDWQKKKWYRADVFKVISNV